VTTGDRLVVFYGPGVSPSSPGEKTSQVFGAERQPSAAAGSGSEARASAVGSQLQGVVRHGCPMK
jgi:hypothetical protein